MKLAFYAEPIVMKSWNGYVAIPWVYLIVETYISVYKMSRIRNICTLFGTKG